MVLCFKAVTVKSQCLQFNTVAPLMHPISLSQFPVFTVEPITFFVCNLIPGELCIHFTATAEKDITKYTMQMNHQLFTWK